DEPHRRSSPLRQRNSGDHAQCRCGSADVTPQRPACRCRLTGFLAPVRERLLKRTPAGFVGKQETCESVAGAHAFAPSLIRPLKTWAAASARSPRAVGL